MKGYLGEPDKTAECVTDDGWLLTGDIAKVCDIILNGLLGCLTGVIAKVRKRRRRRREEDEEVK